MVRRLRACFAPGLLLGLAFAAAASAQEVAAPERAQAQRELRDVLLQIERLGEELRSARREHRAERNHQIVLGLDTGRLTVASEPTPVEPEEEGSAAAGSATWVSCRLELSAG